MEPDPLQRWRGQPLDLDALCAAANAVLAGRRAPDGRVAEAVEPRTVRYYATLGLVEKPAYEGRSAVYGARHLAQVLAVRLLQTQGHSLAQIQAALGGRTPAEVEAAVIGELGGPAPRPAPRPRWVTAELAPGVLVTVDTGVVPDADALIHHLTLSLGARR